MLGPPFGLDAENHKIRDVSGIAVRANVEYVEEEMERRNGPGAGTRAVHHLVKLLNARIANPSYHVTPSSLKNAWMSYSYEFVMYLAEFCEQMTEDPHFHRHMATAKFLHPIIQILGRPLSIAAIYKKFPYFVDKFTHASLQGKVITVTNSTATLRLSLTDHAVRQLKPYLRRSAHLICETTKATIATMPQQMGHLAPATIVDRQCMGNGDPYCEWDVQWVPPTTRGLPWWGLYLLISVASYGFLYWRYPFLSTIEFLLGALVPALGLWLGHDWFSLRKQLNDRERLIQEQYEFVDMEHEALREAHSTQGLTTVQYDMLKQLFSANLSPQIAEAIWTQRDQILVNGRPRAQELTATVLFVDVANFTRVAELLPPAQVLEVLNGYLEGLTQVATEHGGLIDNYIGDGMKIDFGVPVPRTTEAEIQEDARQAVRCALAMREKMEELQGSLGTPNCPPLHIRMGMATGPVVAGTLGTTTRMKYTTLGDTVNVASRLENLGRDRKLTMDPHPILISEETAKCLDQEFQFQKVGEIAIKGRVGTPNVYSVSA
jgi:class 3 adenylate cyclase